ncbi:MAG: hypothetical protein D6706_20855, partial [Chloroflexi bacterium]
HTASDNVLPSHPAPHKHLWEYKPVAVAKLLRQNNACDTIPSASYVHYPGIIGIILDHSCFLVTNLSSTQALVGNKTTKCKFEREETSNQSKNNQSWPT